jgi:hypothetical protein
VYVLRQIVIVTRACEKVAKGSGRTQTQVWTTTTTTTMGDDVRCVALSYTSLVLWLVVLRVDNNSDKQSIATEPN